MKTIAIGLVLALASPPAPASPELAPPPSPAEPAPPPSAGEPATRELAPPPSAGEPATPPAASEPVTTEPATPPEPTPPEASGPVTTEPAAAEPVKTEPVTTKPVTTEPTGSHGDRRPGDRMVKAGVGVVVAGVLGYVVMAAGLAMGNRAQGELFSLPGRDDIDARREVLARGQLGNRLAIGGAIVATAAMAVGIPLILIGRRRHEAASPRATVMVSGGAAGLGLRVVGRF